MARSLTPVLLTSAFDFVERLVRYVEDKEIAQKVRLQALGNVIVSPMNLKQQLGINDHVNSVV